MPDDETLAEAVSITKSSLSGTLDKQAYKELIADLKEAGAISESHPELLRKVKSRRPGHS